MTDLIHNIFSTIFGDNVILATVLIAMVPIIELRGAIPFATNPGFWGKHALSNWEAFGWSLLGSSIIVPIVALTSIPLINWLKKTKLFKKITISVENRIKSKAQSIKDSNIKSARFSKSYWKKLLGVFIFVAVPLPLTGVWTGTLVSLFVGLDFYSTCISVILGNIVAGLLISLILLFFPWLNDWLFFIFIGIIIVVLLFEFIKHIISNKKNKTENQLNNENSNNSETN